MNNKVKQSWVNNIIQHYIMTGVVAYNLDKKKDSGARTGDTRFHQIRY